MTRKEAIKHITTWMYATTDLPPVQVSEAFDMAIAALRPVSRERVEKVWRGCEKCNGAGEYSRYAENLTKTLLAKYCPHCGRPLTDEAVDIVMRRLEALKDGSTSDKN